MRSSYKSKVDYGDLFETIVFTSSPRLIVEFGVLDGYSLSHMAKYADSKCQIKAYDIFEDFVGNSADYKKITKKFSSNQNVTIEKLDFYKGYQLFTDNSIDILHIDIANTGDVYTFAVEHYMSKLARDGLMILEGGSQERDNVEWMNKYNKEKINPILAKLRSQGYQLICIEKYPSITIIKKR